MQSDVNMFSREKLISEIDKGRTFDYFYFWGHKSPSLKSCLSQFYPARFKVGDEEYLFAEQYMMSQKAKLFGDNETYKKIMSSTNPFDIKKLGREVKNFDPDVWDKHKTDIVYTANINKFYQNKELKDFLLSTGDAILVEASPYDRIWGIGMYENDPQIGDPREWAGENLLGFILTEVREELKTAP